MPGGHLARSGLVGSAGLRHFTVGDRTSEMELGVESGPPHRCLRAFTQPARDSRLARNPFGRWLAIPPSTGRKPSQRGVARSVVDVPTVRGGGPVRGARARTRRRRHSGLRHGGPSTCARNAVRSPEPLTCARSAKIASVIDARALAGSGDDRPGQVIVSGVPGSSGCVFFGLSAAELGFESLRICGSARAVVGNRDRSRAG